MTSVDEPGGELRRAMLDMDCLNSLESLFRCERRGVCLLNFWLGSCKGMARCTCRAKFSEWYVLEDDAGDLEDLPF